LTRSLDEIHADRRWGVYQMLGKLRPTIYTPRRP
jgi:hypothetical protein